MGKKSGLDNIAVWSEKLGIKLDKDDALEVLKRVKLQAHELKRALNEAEFQGIIKGVKAEKRN